MACASASKRRVASTASLQAPSARRTITVDSMSPHLTAMQWPNVHFLPGLFLPVSPSSIRCSTFFAEPSGEDWEPVLGRAARVLGVQVDAEGECGVLGGLGQGIGFVLAMASMLALKIPEK